MLLKEFKLNLKNNIKQKLIFEGIITLFAMIIMIIHSFNVHIPNMYIISIILFLLATFLVFYLEFNYFYNYRQLKNRDFSMDFLITIATHLTYFYSVIMSIIEIVQKNFFNLNMQFYEIGYELSFFIGIGHLIEDKLRVKTSLGIKELLKLQNKEVEIVQDNQIKKVKTNQIQLNDVVKVAKGQAIPTDGILLSDHAYLDYSSLLGEAIPRDINKNQLILSGSINVGDLIYYQVTKLASDSTLNKIINQLEKIMNNKSKIEVTSQKIVKYFLPTVLIISLITFILWLILLYLPISIPAIFNNVYENPIYENPIANALYHAVATLVIACPCAFGIAAPAAIYSSSFIASKNKILFSSSKIYEMINDISFVAFDKTGTITEGKPFVAQYLNQNKQYDSYIYNLATLSNHPLSQAIKNYFANNNNETIEFENVKEILGVGIFATKSKNTYAITSLKYAKENNYVFHQKENFDENKSISVFSINNEVISYFQIEDQIKKDALQTIKNLQNMNIKLIILSGDRKENVEKIAHQLGIDYWYGDLLPDQKAEIINEFKSKGKIIFVGDGTNDILAIKSASIGIAYASGSELTNSIADISLLENNLNLVYKAILLSRKTLNLVKLNFVWAGIFNIICIPLAILGLIAPWLGAILMVGSTSVLLLNTLIAQKRNKSMISKI